MQKLNVPWATMKAVKAFQFHYTSRGAEANPSYYVYGTDGRFFYSSEVEASADIADFETNYQSTSNAVADEHIASAVAETQVDLVQSVTTATAVEATVLTYTVPANKTLYVSVYSISRITSSTTGADPALLRVAGVIKDRKRIDSVTTALDWVVKLDREWPLATGGQVVLLTVDATGATSTIWSGQLRGVLR